MHAIGTADTGTFPQNIATCVEVAHVLLAQVDVNPRAAGPIGAARVVRACRLFGGNLRGTDGRAVHSVAHEILERLAIADPTIVAARHREHLTVVGTRVGAGGADRIDERFDAVDPSDKLRLVESCRAVLTEGNPILHHRRVDGRHKRTVEREVKRAGKIGVRRVALRNEIRVVSLDGLMNQVHARKRSIGVALGKGRLHGLHNRVDVELRAQRTGVNLIAIGGLVEIQRRIDGIGGACIERRDGRLDGRTQQVEVERRAQSIGFIVGGKYLERPLPARVVIKRGLDRRGRVDLKTGSAARERKRNTLTRHGNRTAA